MSKSKKDEGVSQIGIATSPNGVELMVPPNILVAAFHAAIFKLAIAQKMHMLSADEAKPLVTFAYVVAQHAADLGMHQFRDLLEETIPGVCEAFEKDIVHSEKATEAGVSLGEWIRNKEKASADAAVKAALDLVNGKDADAGK